MCGIAGLVSPQASLSEHELRSRVMAMTDAIAHRGPDDHGFWIDPPAGVALGHRRLSIVDLSPAGHQPMLSRNGRYVIVYNGEVYTHRELREELLARGASFRGSSDTEVMLEAFSEWSIESSLARFNGMFGFAVWDRTEQALTLVRDRLGIKPLYWALFNDVFVFGSELKALRACAGWDPGIRADAVAAYMRHGYIPGPHSIYENVQKLEPGTILTWRPRLGTPPKIERYWDLSEVAQRGSEARRGSGSQQLVEELDTLLRDAVSRRMIADVPLGAFISGGIDSSTVAALMQAQSIRPVKTYCIGFEQAEFNEAPYASAVARHLGTEHTELYVTPKDALDTIPEIPRWYDEPFADASQVPTLLVSQLTRRHVTVALSGDGGDELFGGYDRYFWTMALQRWFDRVPAVARNSTRVALEKLVPQLRAHWFNALPRFLRGRLTRSRLQKMAEVLSAPDSDILYRQILSIWANPLELVRTDKEARGRLWDATLTQGLDTLLERMQFTDAINYLPDDILTKVDRASMAVALEARVPLIDYRVVEFAWRLPESMKVREGKGKWILRQVLAKYVPDELIDRPKKGFGVPLGTWLRGPLREWAESLLSEQELTRNGLLDVPLVRRMWAEHVSGERNCETPLWLILMLQAWMREWG